MTTNYYLIIDTQYSYSKANFKGTKDRQRKVKLNMLLTRSWPKPLNWSFWVRYVKRWITGRPVPLIKDS